MDDRHAAWEAVHEATLPGWLVVRPRGSSPAGRPATGLQTPLCHHGRYAARLSAKMLRAPWWEAPGGTKALFVITFAAESHVDMKDAETRTCERG